MDARGYRLRERVDVREVISSRVANDVRRFLSGLKLLDCVDEKFAHGDHRLVAHPQVLARAIEDRPHGFGGAAVVLRKFSIPV